MDKINTKEFIGKEVELVIDRALHYKASIVS